MFAEAVGPARSFASKHRYRIDEDQELVGMGMANLGAGFFQGFPIGASLSKSAAADAAGGRSQVAGIVAAVATALVALFLTPLFENLPEAALGAIVIVAVSGMFKWGELKRLYRLRKTDFWLAMIALLGVMTFEEVLYGLLIAVLASLVALIMRTRRPQISELGRLPGTLQFRSLEAHPEATRSTSLLIVRPDETVFFANAASIREDRAHDSEPKTNLLLAHGERVRLQHRRRCRGDALEQIDRNSGGSGRPSRLAGHLTPTTGAPGRADGPTSESEIRKLGKRAKASQ